MYEHADCLIGASEENLFTCCIFSFSKVFSFPFLPGAERNQIWNISCINHSPSVSCILADKHNSKTLHDCQKNTLQLDDSDRRERLLHSSHPADSLHLTSHWFCGDWFLSWISQSCWPSHTAQWCMVMMTGRVNKAPGGPQLTTGLRTVWPSSTEGLEVDGKHTHTFTDTEDGAV